VAGALAEGARESVARHPRHLLLALLVAGLLAGPRSPPALLAAALAVTVAATIGTAPLIALHFERLSLVSLPANVLAAPAVAVVMWLGAIAGALGQLAPGLAAPVGKIAAIPLAYLTWIADRAAALPFAELSIGSPGIGGVVAVYLAAGVALLVWRRRQARRSEEEAEAHSGRGRGHCEPPPPLPIAAPAAVATRAARPPPPDRPRRRRRSRASRCSAPRTAAPLRGRRSTSGRRAGSRRSFPPGPRGRVRAARARRRSPPAT